MMKRSTSALVLSAAVALPTVTLASGPIDGTVYGKANISYQHMDTSKGKAWELANNASRLGVKGKTALNDQLNIIYQLEYEVFIDDGDDGSDDHSEFKQRNIFVGLTSKTWGEIIGGKFDTPLKKSQGKVDLFNDLKGDIKNILIGDNRKSNVVQYTTPSMSGIKAKLAVIPGEDATDDNADTYADSMSASIEFSNDQFYAALAYDSDIEKLDGSDTLRLSLQAKFGALTLGALWQSAEYDNATFATGEDSEDGYSVSAAYKIGSETVKIQYSASDEKLVGGEMISLGIDHKLSKKSKLYAFYTDIQADDATKEKSYFGVGMEHKF